MKRCPKHEPRPLGDTIEQMRGRIICARCGMEGLRSNGSRAFGRPARIIWLRREFALGNSDAVTRRATVPDGPPDVSEKGPGSTS
jgi:hypothetical protein